MNKQGNEKHNQDDLFNQFNFSDFKKWMHTQDAPDNHSKPIIGLNVESKISVKKLMSTMDAQDNGDEEEIAEDFKKNGGVISEMDGHNLLIDVESGSFIIHKMYVKKS